MTCNDWISWTFFNNLVFKTRRGIQTSSLGYFEIITNIFVGFSFFGYLPDIYIYTGLILIVSSGIYIFIREKKKFQIINFFL